MTGRRKTREIRPYAAEAFPAAFSIAVSCQVWALDAKRTFWEKATILHAEHHRPADKPLAAGMSRPTTTSTSLQGRRSDGRHWIAAIF